MRKHYTLTFLSILAYMCGSKPISACTVAATTTSSVVCTGQSSTLNANITSIGGTSPTYVWFPVMSVGQSVVVTPTVTTTYTVMAMQTGMSGGSDTCYASVTVSVSSCLYIPNNEVVAFSVSPNPATNSISVNFGTLADNNDMFMEIYNSVGQIAFTKKIRSTDVVSQKFDIDIKDLPSGVYSITMRSEGRGAHSVRLLKE